MTYLRLHDISPVTLDQDGVDIFNPATYYCTVYNGLTKGIATIRLSHERGH